MAESNNRAPAALLLRLFQPTNRGLLLDATVFVLNLTAMSALTRGFAGVVTRAGTDDPVAHTVLLAAALALFVLAPLGAVLKRWRFHETSKGRSNAIGSDPMGGCLFNPIFYFCLTALIFATANAFLFQIVYGRREPPAALFVGSVFLGLALMIVHTVLVYRYFAPPKSPPKSGFLRSPTSGILGDVCFFLNMALFQVIWNLLSGVQLPHPSGVADLLFRFLVLLFLALLLYFPPRMFYLAEDIGRRRTWLSILLANSPLLVRVLIGSDSGIWW